MSAITIQPKIVKVKPNANGVSLSATRKEVNVKPQKGAVFYTVTAGQANQVFGEVPSGAVNGSNATFTTAYNFVAGSVQVFVNGLLQKIITDYNTSGTTTILLAVSPTVNENILVNYLKA